MKWRIPLGKGNNKGLVLLVRGVEGSCTRGELGEGSEVSKLPSVGRMHIDACGEMGGSL